LCNIFFPGANSGIGKETALDLAKRGARLILLCRNVDKAQKAAEHIKKTHNGAQIAVHQLDLASLKSVRNCAQTLIDTEDKIDILVNNAGEILIVQTTAHYCYRYMYTQYGLISKGPISKTSQISGFFKQ
jgi:short-subunit dehydrogenase